MTKVKLNLPDNVRTRIGELYTVAMHMEYKLNGISSIMMQDRPEDDCMIGLGLLLEGFANELKEVVNDLDSMHYGHIDLTTKEPDDSGDAERKLK
jgi:hypothetical protein